MSRGRSGRADSPTAGKSRRQARVNWDKVKVFAKPEYRLPWKMPAFYPGKKPVDYQPPDIWLQVAVESGLVEIPKREDPGRAGEWLEPIDEYSVEPHATREELEALIRKGIQEVLDYDASQEAKKDPDKK